MRSLSEPRLSPRSLVRRDVSPRPATLRTVFFPSDLSAEADRAFAHARAIADRFGATLTLYHVDEFPRAWSVAEASARESSALLHLERLADGLGLVREYVVDSGGTAREALLRRVRALQPDLTVMATRGRTGVAQVLLGSVAETLVRHSPTPVLCVRPPDHGGTLPYRRLLVPTDLTPESRTAFPLAALIARAFDAELLPLHVARLPEPRVLIGVPHAVRAAVPDEQAVGAYGEREWAGLRVRPLVRLGTPWEQILRAVREEEVDLVVMATRGHDSLADRFLGTNAERVVRLAACPVLVA